MDEYLSGRFRGAEKAYRNTAKKYGKENVQVTGHSLGGSQAVHVGRKYGVEGTAFEPGSGVAGAFRRAREDIGNEPAVQEKMKKKVAKKRDRKCIEAIVKAGGDDSHPDVVKFVAKKPKGGEKEVTFVAKPKSVPDKSTKPKSLRGGHARKP